MCDQYRFKLTYQIPLASPSVLQRFKSADEAESARAQKKKKTKRPARALRCERANARVRSWRQQKSRSYTRAG